MMFQGEKLTEEGPDWSPCIKSNRVELDGMEGKSKVVAPDENGALEVSDVEIGIATKNFGVGERRGWDPDARNWKIEKFIEGTLKIGSDELKKKVDSVQGQLGNDGKKVKNVEMNRASGMPKPGATVKTSTQTTSRSWTTLLVAC